MLASLLSGSFLGVFGSIGTGVLNFFKQRQANKHELDVLAAQKDLALIAGNNNLILEAFKTLQSSYGVDTATYQGANFPSVDWWRGMVRPITLLFLVVMSTILALWAFKKVGIGSMLTENIVEHAVKSVYEFTGLAIGWYFGSRSLVFF